MLAVVVVVVVVWVSRSLLWVPLADSGPASSIYIYIYIYIYTYIHTYV